jgi:protocatechuate 3,4-dioxygenase beta subunit
MRVSGRVVDDGGRAIAGARVEIDSDLAVPTLRADGTTTTPIGYQAASREDGSFEVAFIPPARRRMIVRATGYLPHDQWIESSDRDTPRRIVMRAGVSIDGRLTNSDGTPAAGARVFAEKVPASISDPVHADENGLYRLEGIASGPTRLWAVDESGADTVATTVIDLQVGVEGRWDATLEPRAGWRLRIVDRAGKPIACCRVSFHVPVFAAGTHPEEHHSALEAFYGWNRWGITDAEGRVVVRDGPEKPLDIQVFLPRAGSTFPTAELNAVPSSLDERVVTLDSDDRALATLTGSVRDAEGRPLAQGSLYLINQETESARIIALDAADGRFNITGIPPSTYRIQATAPKQGWADLGSHTLSAGAVVDLGALTTPTLARLQVDWRWDEVKEPGPYTFALAMQWKGASDTYVAMSVDAGAEPGTGEYALFPGLYSLHVFRGGVARQFRVFALPPFEHLDVESGEDELFLLPLHIEQARPAGVALSVTVRVSELEHPETTVLEETFNLPAEGILDAHVRLAAGAYLVEARSGSELRGSAKVELGSEQLIRRLPIRLE